MHASYQTHVLVPVLRVDGPRLARRYRLAGKGHRSTGGGDAVDDQQLRHTGGIRPGRLFSAGRARRQVCQSAKWVIGGTKDRAAPLFNFVVSSRRDAQRHRPNRPDPL